MKPSDIIEDIINKTEYDYRDPCGANNCECYNNSIAIQAIIKYLDDHATPKSRLPKTTRPR